MKKKADLRALRGFRDPNPSAVILGAGKLHFVLIAIRPVKAAQKLHWLAMHVTAKKTFVKEMGKCLFRGACFVVSKPDFELSVKTIEDPRACNGVYALYLV